MKKKLFAVLAVAVVARTFSFVSPAPHIKTKAESPSSSSELVLPNSYEEYLPLESPSSISVSKHYIAIADGYNVYVYNRALEQYSLYSHAEEIVKRLQFSLDETLYFSDSSTKLYSLDPETLQAEKTPVSCSTFTISADTLYFTTIPEDSPRISSAKLTSLDKQTLVLSGKDFTGKPLLAQENGVIYYTNSYKILQKIDEPFFSRPLTESTSVESLAVKNGCYYYRDELQNLYMQTPNDGDKPVLLDTGCTAVTAADDGYIYVVKEKIVRRYDPETKSFDSYEISANSPSSHRLSEATDVFLFDKKLFVCDTGNSRLSVFDTETGSNFTLPVSEGCKYVAADQNTVLIASERKAELFDLQEKNKLASFSFDNDLTGITCVYGTYYLITKGNRYLKTEYNTETNSYELKSITRATSAPRALTSDIFGSLYVFCADGCVYRYSEAEFMHADVRREQTDSLAALPTETKKFSVDFEKSIYALANTTLYKFTADETTQYSLAKSIVYSQTDETTVSSFSFGAEDNATYLLYDGNFLVKTNELNLPTVRSVPVNGADEKVFEDSEASFSLVTIEPYTLYIDFDENRFREAEVFPYLSHRREDEERTALKLGEAGNFNVVAVFDSETKTYSASLVEKTSCTEISQTEFLKPAVGFEENENGYVTSALPLYKYPYLTDLLTVTNVPKNTEVVVLGQIDNLDYKYYLVSVTIDGKTVKGYLPQAYVSDFSGTPPETTKNLFGDEHTDLDSVWRASFILLGFASICILSDYLILRKKD